MNKKKIFSRTLYMEGIRQLKIIGFIFLILYVLEAIFIPLNQMEFYSNHHAHSVIVGINQIHPAIYLTYTIVAPILTLYLFRFLTKRDSSDFYHSIPDTRTCLYISYVAAILTWIAFILFVSSAVSISIFIFLPIFSVNFSMVIPYIIGVFVASIGVVCGISLAQCITGTVLTNIIVSGIILFFPRLLTFVVTENILNNIYELIPGEYFMPALNGKYNLITAMFLNSRDSISLSLFTKYSSWIYTFILSLIYFAIGLFLFNKRHSESAGNSAPSRWLQAAYRICITLAFCFIPITMICQDALIDNMAIFTLYCIAAVIYFIFEIITTKTVRNLLKIIPGLILIAILNVGIIIFINTVSDYELNRCPEASEVSYINSITVESDCSFMLYSGVDAYKFTDIIYENIKIKDEQLINAILEALESDIGYCNTIPDYIYDGSNQFRTFAIHMKNGSTYYRKININQTTSSKNRLSAMLNDYLSDNMKSAELLEHLPDYKDITVNLSQRNAKDAQKKALYNAFLEDYAAFSPEEKANFIEDGYFYENLTAYSENPNTVGEMNVVFYVNNKYSYINIPISTKLSNTFETYVNFFYDDSSLEEFKNMFSDIEEYILDTKQSLDIYVYNSESSANYYYYYSSGKVECSNYTHQKEISSILSQLSEYMPDNMAEFKDSITDCDSYLKFVIRPSEADFEYSSILIVIPVTDEAVELYNSLIDFEPSWEE